MYITKFENYTNYLISTQTILTHESRYYLHIAIIKKKKEGSIAKK